MIGFGEVRVLDQPPLPEYDLFIAALGYEPRCTFAALEAEDRFAAGLAIAFPGADAENVKARAEFEGAGFAITSLPDQDVRPAIRTELDRFAIDGLVRVAVDISSFTRLRILGILEALEEFGAHGIAQVDFFYSPSKPPEPADEDPVRITSARPISPLFAGWGGDPALPLAVVVGVGIERDLALGVAEHLDVAKIHAFVPRGIDKKFDKLATKANAEFFLEDYHVRQSVYDLTAPTDLFARLESLTYGLLRENRVALVPLGPKIFALVALLVALRADGAIAVWRFSEGESGNHYAAIPSGIIVSLRADFSPSE